MKTCLAIVALCCMGSPAWSQVAASQGSTRPAPPSNEPKLVQITVAAQDAPDPALKYQLLPSAADRTSGNPVLMYYLAQNAMPGKGSAAEEQRQRDQISSYLELPLSDLPAKEVEALLSRYATTLRQVETGALREDADWGLPLSEGFTMILPNLSDFRQMAKVLSLRARLEIAQGRFDQAIHTIQIGLSMGRHVGEGGPTVINSLVGIAIEALILERVQELISQGGPNLYWALAGLPEPLVGIRQAMEYERQVLAMSRPEFHKAMAGPISPAEGAALLRTIGELRFLGRGDVKRLGPLGEAVLAARYYGIGKRTLIERGRSRDQVEAMPVGQVAALYLMEDYLHWRDETFKWFGLPYWQARAGLESSQQAFGKWVASGGWLNPLTGLLPTLGRAYFLQASLDRTRAALQTIEAVRSYAAHHDGRPPQTLDQLELPAPSDPVTGKAFQYDAQGAKFTLIGPAPQGAAAWEGVRYEVSLTPPAQAATTTTAPAAAPRATRPAEGAWQGIEKFIQDGTIAVIQVDLAALTSDAAWKQISAVVQESKLGEEVLPMLAQVRDMGKKYAQAGAAEAFIVVDIADLPIAMPMIVVPLGKDVDADKLAALLPVPGDRSRVQRGDGALVVATEDQVRALRDYGPAQHPRLMKAMAFSNGAVRVAFAFSDDTRRALEETLGTLPPELGILPVTTLTRGLQWASLDITVQPEIALRLVVQAPDAASAKALGTLIDRALESAVKLQQEDPAAKVSLKALAAAVRPQVRGDQLVLQLNQAQMVLLIRDAVSPATQKARGQARRAVSAANISGMLKACYMWAADHQGMFPPDLQTLVKGNMLPPRILVSPLRPELGQAGYIYVRPGVPEAKLEHADEQIVVYEAHERFGEGVNVGFADGHVQWIADEARFKALLKKSESAGTTSRPATQPASP